MQTVIQALCYWGAADSAVLNSPQRDVCDTIVKNTYTEIEADSNTGLLKKAVAVCKYCSMRGKGGDYLRILKK